MINTSNGTPAVGYISLTSGTLTGTLALFTMMGEAAVTIAANERFYVTNITLSSNDGTQSLVTVDTGTDATHATPTKLASSYLSSVQPPAVVNFPPGTCRGTFGVMLRATASAVTAAKSVEVVVQGYVSKL